MGIHVRSGISAPAGMVGPRLVKELKLGNIIMAALSYDKDEAMRVSRFCKDNCIYLIFAEIVQRGCCDIGSPWGENKIPREEFYTKAELDEICAAAGEYYLGRLTTCEAGGMLYWMREYLIGRKENAYDTLPAVETVDEAKKVFLETIRKSYEFERNELGGGKLIAIEASALTRYILEAGTDDIILEMVPGKSMFSFAALRGACRAYNKESYQSHIAMGWYGGICLDTAWQKRWKMSLYASFMAGCDGIYPETGHLTYEHMGRNLGFESSEMTESRRTLREFNQFSQIHSRPKDGPKVNLGFVFGNLDAYHGPRVQNKAVWGQAGAKWEFGPAEWGWECVDVVDRKPGWDDETVVGDMDFSGHPPYGQYDLVPIETSQENLNKYSCLVFVGWNTMTDEIYAKLKAYVEQGGRLFMGVPHLSTEVDRAKGFKLYKDGDWRDLLGVVVKGKGLSHIVGIKTFEESAIPGYRMPLWITNTDPFFTGHLDMSQTEIHGARIISGVSTDFWDTRESLSRVPALTEFSLGKGFAYLINSWAFPGDRNWQPFFKDLLNVIAEGEQGDVRLIGSDNVQYAVYEGKVPGDQAGTRVIYLLNQEYDVPQTVFLWIDGKKCPGITLQATDMNVVYERAGVVLSPADRGVELEAWRVDGDKQEISMFARTDTDVMVSNQTSQTVAVSINSRSVTLATGDEATIRIAKRVDPERPEFYADDYLVEPAVADLPELFPNGDLSALDEMIY
jgi:hypothetical protein